MKASIWAMSSLTAVKLAPRRDGSEHREPNLDLIEPRGMSGGKVKVEPRMLAPKSRIADAMGAEIVEHDMEIFVGMCSFQPSQEIKELLAPFARFAHPINTTGGHFQSSKESHRSMTLIVVSKTAQSATIGHFEPALGSLQCLDARLLIDGNNHSVLRGIQIQTNHIGSLGGELWIGRNAPTAPP